MPAAWMQLARSGISGFIRLGVVAPGQDAGNKTALCIKPILPHGTTQRALGFDAFAVTIWPLRQEDRMQRELFSPWSTKLTLF